MLKAVIYFQFHKQHTLTDIESLLKVIKSRMNFINNAGLLVCELMYNFRYEMKRSTYLWKPVGKIVTVNDVPMTLLTQYFFRVPQIF